MKKDYVRIHFLNYCNTYDAINFRVSTIDNETIDNFFRRSLSGDFDTTQTGVERYNNLSNDTYNGYNTCYKEKHSRWVQELFNSTKCLMEYHAEGNRKIYIPIYLTSKTFRKLDINKEIQINIQFKLSNEFRTIRN